MDKKKKILALVAVVLVGGLVALSSTGGIGNLRSSMIWVDTGDGNGYYANVEEDPANTVGSDTTINNGGGDTGVDAGNTGNSLINQLTIQINALNATIQKLQGNETVAGSIKNLNKELTNLQNRSKTLTADAKTANDNWTTANSDYQKALKPIDLYACTKTAAYKGKNYVYAKTDTLSPTEVMQNRFTELRTLVFVTQPAKITSLKAEYTSIPATNKTARAAKDKEVKAAEAELTKITNERAAIDKNKSNSKCVTPITTIYLMKEKIKPIEQKKVDADAAKKANADAIKTQQDTVAAATAALAIAQSNLDDTQKALNNLNNQNQNNGGNGSTSNKGGIVLSNKSEQCDNSTELFNQGYEISEVKIGGNVKFYLNYDFNGDFPNGYGSYQEAKDAAYTLICKGQVFRGHCYLDILASLQALNKTKFSYLPDEQNFQGCKKGCQDMLDSYINTVQTSYKPLGSIPVCKDTFSTIFQPEGDFEKLNDMARMLKNKCDSDCDASNNENLCGNGVFDGDEACDDNNKSNDDTCSDKCQPTYCGDGTTQTTNGRGTTETCDDANTIDGDGCSASCQTESSN